MRTTRQLSITLPHEMAEVLRERVRSGAYASESEVIRDGLRALFARGQAVDAWLREEVAASYDALIADPNDVATADAVRLVPVLRAHRRRRCAARGIGEHHPRGRHRVHPVLAGILPTAEPARGTGEHDPVRDRLLGAVLRTARRRRADPPAGRGRAARAHRRARGIRERVLLLPG